MRTALRYLPVFLLTACENPVADDPDGAPLTALEVEVAAPDLVQANDSFDVEVTLRNTDDEPSRRTLVVEVCYPDPLSDECTLLEVGFVGQIAAGVEDTVRFRTALDEDQVGFGGWNAWAVCLSDASDRNDVDRPRQCGQTETHTMPDVAALCDPSLAAIPTTGSTADYFCENRHMDASVLAVDLEAGRIYEYEFVTGGGGFLWIYDDRGVEHFTGSTPDGKWFVVESTGRYYLVLAWLDEHYDFALFQQDST